ncbi:MAG TPA: DUF5683 domain-containing protein [Chitinophagaceae bacterium]|nr:DUF5683 domain-containing protein [Chitinophagaceae bacterium]
MLTNQNFYRRRYFLTALLAASFILPALAQEPDTTKAPEPAIIAKEGAPKEKDNDSLKRKTHSPRAAALRSAILPGLGQIYNKKYWKLPIVYGALGITGGIFFYNLTNYRDTRFAYRVKYNMRVNGTDSALFVQIKDQLKPLSEESLRFYRNQFRRDIDYSVLFFLVFWGLNVVDAAVDAHLKSFDVSPDLSFRIKPGYSEMAGTNGISLVLNIR